MNLKFRHAELHLGHRETIGLRDATGTLVQCLRGVLWITQNGDRKDYFLGAGETLKLDRAGLALIHAAEAADFALFAPPPPLLVRTRLYRLVLATLRAIGGWFAQNFGPQAIAARRLRGWYGAL